MPRQRRGEESAMRLLTRTLLLLAAASVAASYEGTYRVRPDAPPLERDAHEHALEVAQGLPLGASWETLFNANWR
jgi:hypothetical protein